jgi:hypothetical protein
MLEAHVGHADVALQEVAFLVCVPSINGRIPLFLLLGRFLFVKISKLDPSIFEKGLFYKGTEDWMVLTSM